MMKTTVKEIRKDEVAVETVGGDGQRLELIFERRVKYNAVLIEGLNGTIAATEDTILNGVDRT